MIFVTCVILSSNLKPNGKVASRNQNRLPLSNSCKIRTQVKHAFSKAPESHKKNGVGNCRVTLYSGVPLCNGLDPSHTNRKPRTDTDTHRHVDADFDANIDANPNRGA